MAFCHLDEHVHMDDGIYRRNEAKRCRFLGLIYLKIIVKKVCGSAKRQLRFILSVT